MYSEYMKCAWLYASQGNECQAWHYYEMAVDEKPCYRYNSRNKARVEQLLAQSNQPKHKPRYSEAYRHWLNHDRPQTGKISNYEYIRFLTDMR